MVIITIGAQHFNWAATCSAFLQTSLVWIQAQGGLGVLVFIVLYNVTTLLLIPSSLLTLGAGILYGLFWGSLYVMIAAILGAIFAFLIGRYWARNWVNQQLQTRPHFQAIDRAVAQAGIKIVLLTRLSPIFPFNLTNYIFGATCIPIKDYMIGSLGIIPGVILYVYIGVLIGDLASLFMPLPSHHQISLIGWLVKSIGLICAGVTTLLITRLAKTALQPTQPSSSQSDPEESPFTDLNFDATTATIQGNFDLTTVTLSNPSIPDLNSILVIIPVLNEAATIATVIRTLQNWGFQQIRVVDNGSWDRSPEIALNAGTEVVYEPISGYGRACWRGLQHLPPAIEWILFCDGDGSDDLLALDRFLNQSDRFDLILGDRTATAAGRAAMTSAQRFGNWLSTRLIWLGWGYRYRDLGPLRLIRRAALEQIQMQDRGFGWTVEMQVRAIECGLRICELPVNYRCRQGGRSKISGTIQGSIQAGVVILKTLGSLYGQRWYKQRCRKFLGHS
ncbi:MAG: VTT domain-containing protein [Elainella sp. Prado103]|nr:VTT domain-containing protein [Elainella sp. Prado103]